MKKENSFSKEYFEVLIFRTKQVGFRITPPPLNIDLGDTSRDENEARSGLVLAVGRVCSKKKKVEKKQHEKIYPAQNTPRKPQQPGEPDHLETAREKTRVMR